MWRPRASLKMCNTESKIVKYPSPPSICSIVQKLEEIGALWPKEDSVGLRSPKSLSPKNYPIGVSTGWIKVCNRHQMTSHGLWFIKIYYHSSKLNSYNLHLLFVAFPEWWRGHCRFVQKSFAEAPQVSFPETKYKTGVTSCLLITFDYS